MSVILGSPTPKQLGVPASPFPNFPQTYGTYTDPTGAIVIPGGALERWFAYRQTLGAVRREVIIFGDSTTYGSGGNYSLVQRLRDKASGVSTGGPVGFGMADGGKGIFAGLENLIVYDAPEINGQSTPLTFAGAPDGYDNLVGDYYYDTGSPANAVLTLQFRTTSARLWYSARANAGSFTYSVDGGTPITISPSRTIGTTSKFVYLSGYAANTTHSLTITNLGGRIATAPVSLSASQNAPGSGTFATGTYYYVVTYIYGGGETLPSPVASVVNDGASRSNGLSLPSNGQNSVNVYRSTSSTGPFGFVTGATQVLDNGTTVIMSDTGGSTSSTNPPTTGTTNLNTSATGCYIALAPVNDTGVAFQKQARSGATINGWFFAQVGSPPYTQSRDGSPNQTALGLVHTTVGAPSYTGAPVDTSYPTNERIKPVLAMSHLGFNDLTNSTSADLPMWTEYVKVFAGACQDAGCDGIIISGQLPYNASWPTYGAARFNAMKAQALVSGVGFVDLFYPVGGSSLSYSGGAGNPHLTKVQYQAQADFLWNNLLGLIG